jgi:hypothetical protein
VSDIAIQSTRNSAEGGKRRHKQRPQGARTTTDYDDGNSRKVGGSGMGHVTTAAHSDKRQAWPPTDNFIKLLVVACPNHVYPVRHKLKDCDMMKSFMISGSPTRCVELSKDPGRSHTTPFPRENAGMMVYGAPSLPTPSLTGRCRMSKLSPGPLTHYSWGRGGTGV